MQLIALPVLEIDAVPAPALLHLCDFGRTIRLAGYAWLYRADPAAGWTLIDTGNDAVALLNGDRPPQRQWRALAIAQQMSRHSVKPGQVADVILTHLHHDHIGNIEQFSQARWHVPAIEWEFVQGPQSHLLAPEPLFPRHVLRDMCRHGVFPMVNGAQPVSGLRMRHTGGHSPGCMAVEVLDGIGVSRLVLGGDVMPLYENLSRRVPSGTLWHWGECVTALHELSNLPVPVLPSHDPAVMDQYPGGVIIDD